MSILPFFLILFIPLTLALNNTCNYSTCATCNSNISCFWCHTQGGPGKLPVYGCFQGACPKGETYVECNCTAGHYGVNCSECTCINGTCSDGLQGTGECNSCNLNYYGVNCDVLCQCYSGNCSSGINGTGQCNCTPDYEGKFCNESCPCVNGFCDKNMTCNCYENYYGINCTEICSCVNGECDKYNGSCYCNENYFGKNCDQRCIDENCSILCYCNDSSVCIGDQDKTICDNDISIIKLNISFESLLTQFTGDILAEGSNIILNSTEIYISKNLTLFNSTLLFNSSSITTEGCINISQTNFTVVLSNATIGQKIILLNSTSGCIYGEPFSITFLNQPKCTIVSSVMDSSTLAIAFVKQSKCDNSIAESSFPTWELALIVIASAVGLIIITLLLVMSIGSIRKKNICQSRRSDAR